MDPHDRGRGGDRRPASREASAPIGGVISAFDPVSTAPGRRERVGPVDNVAVGAADKVSDRAYTTPRGSPISPPRPPPPRARRAPRRQWRSGPERTSHVGPGYGGIRDCARAPEGLASGAALPDRARGSKGGRCN